MQIHIMHIKVTIGESAYNSPCMVNNTCEVERPTPTVTVTIIPIIDKVSWTKVIRTSMAHHHSIIRHWFFPDSRLDRRRHSIQKTNELKALSRRVIMWIQPKVMHLR